MTETGICCVMYLALYMMQPHPWVQWFSVGYPHLFVVPFYLSHGRRSSIYGAWIERHSWMMAYHWQKKKKKLIWKDLIWSLKKSTKIRGNRITIASPWLPVGVELRWIIKFIIRKRRMTVTHGWGATHAIFQLRHWVVLILVWTTTTPIAHKRETKFDHTVLGEPP